MQHIRSSDGTSIAYEKTGEGPALIIIGGSLGDHRFYVPMAREFARRFTVYNFDRRGRGQSTDTQPYVVEREIEDVAALVAEVPEPALVYGHSAGSALALHSAVAGLNIAKLVLSTRRSAVTAIPTCKRGDVRRPRRYTSRRFTTAAITEEPQPSSSAASASRRKRWTRCSTHPGAR